MAYFPTESRIGVLGFANVDTTTAVPFGTIIRGQDSASGKGGGEFVYLPGATGVAVGSLVTYNPGSVTGTGLAVSTANLGKPAAVAMAAVNTASKFGWFQVRGVAAVLKAAVKVNPAVKLYLSATSGRLTSVAASGKQLLAAIAANAATVVSATSTVNVLITNPFDQGQVV
jgi:hypothetical protein